ncbi:MAG TPA: calcium-binding protein, partial [Allosphingosinicella sp.]
MIKTVSGEAYAPVADFQLSADTLEYQSSPAFARLDDGGFVAVWSDSRFGNGSMRMQRFDLNGRKVGAEIVLPSGGTPALASTPTGFLLTWTVMEPYPANSEVKARFYDSNLNPTSPEIAVNSTTVAFQENEGVAALAGGGYVVTWGQRGHSSFDDVRAQILDAAGNKVGGEFIVNENVPGIKYAMGLTALAGGGFVAAWTGFEVADQFGNLSPGLRAQIFDAAGNKVGAAFSLNTIVPGNQSNSDLAALPSGGFVAAWTDDGTRQSGSQANGNQGIWVQLFDGLGQKIGAAVRVGTGGDSVVGLPTIAVTSTGFLVTWPQLPTMYAGQNELRAQRFDFNGNKVAEEFVVGSAAAATHVAPTSLVLDGGTILYGWTHRAASGFNYDDVRAQMLIPTQHGTDAADSFAGSAGRDFYLARAGDDSVSGGAADDGLSGGDGNDILNGEQGGDILDGGAGADVMTGGAGDDFYTVGEAGDQVVEQAGEGTDTVETSLVDYAAPEAVENVVGTLGAGTQTLRGNALANVLTGGDADNVFHIGSGGHDVVSGAGGRDTLHIDWSDSTSPVTNEIVSVPFASVPGAVYRDGTGRSVSYSRVEEVVVTTGSGNDFIATPGPLPSTGPLSTRISAGAGNDTAYLNSTFDSFDGGTGIDGVYTSNTAASSGVFEWRVPANLFISPAGTPQLANIEHFLLGTTGSGNDIVETGRLALPDTLLTGSGDDLVTTYHGVDRLFAGPGFDTLVIDWRESTAPVELELNFPWYGGDSLSGSARSGTDRSIVFEEVERLVVLGGSAADGLAGSDRADQLSGGGGDDGLSGGLGDDMLDGGDGDDFLDGGSGADSMTGGAGNDIFSVDDAGDSVTEASGEGTDEVRTTLASYSLLGTSVENLRANSAVAHDFRGNSGGNVVTGGGGNDFLRLQDGGDDNGVGGDGNDVFLFGGTFTSADQVDGGAGTDQIAIQGDYAGAEALTLGSNIVSVENFAIL